MPSVNIHVVPCRVHILLMVDEGGKLNHSVSNKVLEAEVGGIISSISTTIMITNHFITTEIFL